MIYNSANYDNMILDLNYISFSNGHALGYSQFSSNCINYESEFVFPVSAFIFEFNEDMEVDSLVVSFNADAGQRINEIVVLAK